MIVFKKFIFIVIILLLSQCSEHKPLIKDGVYVDLNQGKSALLKDGKPFEIKGVSGFQYLSEAKASRPEWNQLDLARESENNTLDIIKSESLPGFFIVGSYILMGN